MKKSLTQAIALATAIGASASAFAVNVNQDGQGQVLLYPVYTAENGNVTAVSVTNTTDQIKAVKVRFVEGMNSAEVLDFNLYLSPYDVWSGAVVATDTGAKLVTQDNSCTAGKIPAAGQNFVNFAYGSGTAKDTADAKFHGTDRARVGHLEIIEMGEIDPAQVLVPGVTAGQAIIHSKGANAVPGNCDAVRAAWQTGGVWTTNSSAGMFAPAGGLYGTAAVVNVDAGWQSSYDAVAIDEFAGLADLHNKPGSILPSLKSGVNTVAFKDGTTATVTLGTSDAVSAVLMKESIQNDYIVGAGLNAQTDMVITFPTKREYVNGTLRAPFTALWDPAKAQACEQIAVDYYDNEENSLQLEESQFSPQPEVDNKIALCHETNVFSISGSEVLGGAFVKHNLDLDSAFTQGWINVDFTAQAGMPAGSRELALTSHTGGLAALEGLPVIGNSVIVTQNGDVGGLLSNYAATFDHKAKTTLDK